LPFIPVHDGRPLAHIRYPIGTWTLIATNILVFLVVQSGGFAGADQASVFSYGLIPAVYNQQAILPADFVEVPRGLTLLTYAFFHADALHLAGNMVFLWVFADNVEDAFGHVRFVVFYGLCVVGAGFAYVLSDPSSEVQVVGASGAIAGIVAAYFILHPLQKIWVLAFARIPLRLGALWVLGAWIVFQFYAVIVADPDDQVAWWAHIGGLVSGAVLVFVLRRRGVPLFDGLRR
jgi:membrane associated rhomboid family serine protease